MGAEPGVRAVRVLAEHRLEGSAMAVAARVVARYPARLERFAIERSPGRVYEPPEFTEEGQPDPMGGAS